MVNPQRIVDLRSDTVTKPTAGMLAAMQAAEVGDDVYAEDPTTNRLEATVAKLIGKEAAMFVPSGTMSNQIAINIHCRPGDSVIAEADAHVFLYEGGAAAALSGVQFDFVPNISEGGLTALKDAFRPDTLHSATSRLLVVENTHNRGSGRALASTDLRKILAAADSLGLAKHCDGARIWNAAVRHGESEATLAKGFDTISVCFSKGLGAPVGSALCGSAEFIARARKIRKRWGGAMRQSGYLAAAALYALEHHRSKLADDHRRAAHLASSLRERTSVAVRFPELATNMVYFQPPALEAFLAAATERGIRLSAIGGGWVRAVLHLDVSDTDLEYACTGIVTALQAK